MEIETDRLTDESEWEGGKSFILNKIGEIFITDTDTHTHTSVSPLNNKFL